MNISEEPEKVADIPKKPIIHINRIKDKTTLLERGLSRYLGTTLTGDNFFSFKKTLTGLLPENISLSALDASLNAFVLRKVDKKFLQYFCWLFAANYQNLINDKKVKEWQIQENYEWVVGKVVNISATRIRKKFLNKLTFLILSGSPASLETHHTWSNNMAHYLASYRDESGVGFGFGRSRYNSRGEQRGKCIFSDINQFFGLRCLLLLDPTKVGEHPVISEISNSSSTMAFNREIIKQRDREYNDCIKIDKQRHNPECFCCVYGRDLCPLATHSRTFVRVVCSSCDKFAFSDPADLEYKGLCKTCADKERFK